MSCQAEEERRAAAGEDPSLQSCHGKAKKQRHNASVGACVFFPHDFMSFELEGIGLAKLNIQQASESLW